MEDRRRLKLSLISLILFLSCSRQELSATYNTKTSQLVISDSNQFYIHSINVYFDENQSDPYYYNYGSNSDKNMFSQVNIYEMFNIKGELYNYDSIHISCTSAWREDKILFKGFSQYFSLNDTTAYTIQCR